MAIISERLQHLRLTHGYTQTVGADGVRCSPPPEALPDTFCLL